MGPHNTKILNFSSDGTTSLCDFHMHRRIACLRAESGVRCPSCASADVAKGLSVTIPQHQNLLKEAYEHILVSLERITIGRTLHLEIPSSPTPGCTGGWGVLRDDGDEFPLPQPESCNTGDPTVPYYSVRLQRASPLKSL